VSREITVLAYFLTLSQDEADVEESWQAHAPLADAQKVLEGWDPVVQKILKMTPDPLIDWKLV
jgi:hypothetical protein